MYIGVRAFGVDVWSNFILIRYFDWLYKKIIIRSVVYAAAAHLSSFTVVQLSAATVGGIKTVTFLFCTVLSKRSTSHAVHCSVPISHVQVIN